MYQTADWTSKIVVTLSFTVIVVFGTYIWNIRKSSSPPIRGKRKQNIIHNGNSISVNDTDALPEKEEREKTGKVIQLPKFNWTKVGRVQELYFYPLKSGRGESLPECNFTEYGISFNHPGRLTLHDRMFLVYNEDNHRFQTGRNYPTLILVNLSAVDESKVKLEAIGMPSLSFRIPVISTERPKAVECTLWWGERVQCIDCGSEPAEWLSRFLTGTNSGLRLGCAIHQRRNIMEGPWEPFTKVYNKMRNEDTGLFSDLASYMLMTSESLEDLNRRLESPVSSLQFRPNIVISGSAPFTEDKWDWIKIGDAVILRNVKPCPRCSMIGVDPETGKTNKEPMKTLRSFRKQTDPERIRVDGKAPVMGIYCGLYVSGVVKVNDEVFIHVSESGDTD